MPRRIVILFSDTGGGHRSAGEAIAEALRAEHGAEVEVALVDALTNYAPPPFNRLAAWYPTIIARGQTSWGVGYWLLNGRVRIGTFLEVVWPYVRRAVRQIVRENPADIYVNVHPLLTQVVRGLGRPRPPFVTVVTDLVSAHAWWYSAKADLCLVPTEPARRIALRQGYAPEAVRVVGLPVAARFSAPAGDKAALKAQLGWSPDRPTALLVGGGEGMGPLYEIVEAVTAAGLPLDLAVVAGRNQELQDRLKARAWPSPVHVYGFVRAMPDFMRAADVLVTKAGPGTLSEGFLAGLPQILYSHIPGQEAGNVHYVVQEGAGVWAPGPERAVAALRAWFGPDADPAAVRAAAAQARRLARPEAARAIAAIIWELADGRLSGAATA